MLVGIHDLVCLGWCIQEVVDVYRCREVVMENTVLDVEFLYVPTFNNSYGEYKTKACNLVTSDNVFEKLRSSIWLNPFTTSHALRRPKEPSGLCLARYTHLHPTIFMDD